MSSFNATVQNYQDLLREKRERNRLDLLNDDFDTGTVTAPGEYAMADKTYAELLDRLQKQLDALAQAGSQQDRFYAGLLGMIFGHNVDSLRGDNFDVLIKEAGEMLDQFFKESIPRANALNDLVYKAQSVNKALKAVFELTRIRPTPT